MGCTAAYAQDGYSVSAITVGSGENPITSGIAGTVQLTNETGGFMEVTAQEEQAWFMMGKDFTLGPARASLYGSVGHLQGAPWIGPYASLTLPFAKVGEREFSVSALTWPGFFLIEPRSFREDGVDNPERLNTGLFELYSLTLGPVSAQLSHLNFLDTPSNWLPGLSYTHKLRKDLEVNGSMMWNSNADRAMYYIGATWRPEKK
jgi:hypothetical protein